MIIMKYFRIALLAVALMPFTVNNVGIAQTQHHQTKNVPSTKTLHVDGVTRNMNKR